MAVRRMERMVKKVLMMLLGGGLVVGFILAP